MTPSVRGRFSPTLLSLPRRLFFLVLSPVFLLPAPSAWAMDFGINKVRYHTDHQWSIYETAHFEIYYYQKCAPLAKTAAGYAERAFLKTCRVFDYVPKNKIPLFLYGTSAEFQETNISPEFLPEGVGGFTEVFKNRIAIPMTGSYHDLEKVIIHELTHAFQYDLIYGEGWRSLNLFKSVLVPTWMMEGMAEWNAQHVEGQGEMVLRDAVLNDAVLPLNLLDSFSHFEQVYTAYKESQSILDYVTQVYGAEKIPLMMKKMAQNQPAGNVIKALLGISMDELYENWHFYMKGQAWNRINGMPDPGRYGEVLRENTAKCDVSPDGKKVAYLTEGELGLLEVPGKKRTTLLRKVFQTQGSGVAWSPDGRFLSLVTKRDGEDHLCLYDLQKRRLTECGVSGMPLVYSPAWSGDGRFLVFSAFDYKTDDLYRYEISSGRTERLTDDRTSKTWPQYSPDGKFIYFISEEAGETTLRRLELDEEGLRADFGEEPSPVGKDLGFISSLRIRTGTLFLTSNRNNRIFNLYRMGFSGEGLTQLTNTFADVLSAAPSPDVRRFYAGVFQKGKENLYAFATERMEGVGKPPLRLAYLSNTFAGASKIIPLAVGPMEAEEEREHPPAREVPNGEAVKVVKLPSQPPAAIGKLEVKEASDLVELDWILPEAQAQEVESIRVYRAASAGASFALYDKAVNMRQTKYYDLDVEEGRHYFYYLTAVNSAGEGPPSKVVDAVPATEAKVKKYDLSVTPDVLLFLAGYDSAFGFVGGGAVQLSDYLGDHRLSLLGDTIPTVRTGLEVGYEFSQWRTTVDVDFFYFQNFFRVLDLQTGNIVNQYRNNENGFDLNFRYPLSVDSRFEYGIGSQRFQGSPLYLRFSEGISNYFQNNDQWNIANFYRLAFVQDKRRATQYWPSGGYALNFTLLHAVPALDSNVAFANLLFETQVYADLGFLNHLIWANRLVGMSSQGMNPQTFFIGPDQPFQAYFTNLRGYGGNTYFGSNLALWNSELRYPVASNLNFVVPPLNFLLIKGVELAAFMDTGVLSSHFQDLPTSPVLNSVGGGVRFYAFLFERGLVLLRFDLAWRNDQSLPPTFHFNLTPMF